MTFAARQKFSHVVAAGVLARMADLQQELALLRELQDLRVPRIVAANPDVALVVDRDAVVGVGHS